MGDRDQRDAAHDARVDAGIGLRPRLVVDRFRRPSKFVADAFVDIPEFGHGAATQTGIQKGRRIGVSPTGAEDMDAVEASGVRLGHEVVEGQDLELGSDRKVVLKLALQLLGQAEWIGQVACAARR